MLLESNEDECCELVKILMEKSSRLKGAAISSEMLCDKARMLLGPPELGLLIAAGDSSIAEAKSKTISRKTQEAKEAVDSLNENFESANKFLVQRAQMLK